MTEPNRPLIRIHGHAFARGLLEKNDDIIYNITMRPARALRLARSNPAGLRFRDLIGLAEGFGFSLRRQKGSHHIFAHEGLREIMNFQWDGSMAKPYQVRQLLDCVKRHGLRLGDESDD